MLLLPFWAADVIQRLEWWYEVPCHAPAALAVLAHVVPWNPDLRWMGCGVCCTAPPGAIHVSDSLLLSNFYMNRWCIPQLNLVSGMTNNKQYRSVHITSIRTHLEATNPERAEKFVADSPAAVKRVLADFKNFEVSIYSEISPYLKSLCYCAHEKWIKHCMQLNPLAHLCPWCSSLRSDVIWLDVFAPPPRSFSQARAWTQMAWWHC